MLPDTHLVELVLHTAVLDVVVCGVLVNIPDFSIDLWPDSVVVVWVDVYLLGVLGKLVEEVLQDQNVAAQGRKGTDGELVGKLGILKSSK